MLKTGAKASHKARVYSQPPYQQLEAFWIPDDGGLFHSHLQIGSVRVQPSLRILFDRLMSVDEALEFKQRTYRTRWVPQTQQRVFFPQRPWC